MSDPWIVLWGCLFFWGSALLPFLFTMHPRLRRYWLPLFAGFGLQLLACAWIFMTLRRAQAEDPQFDGWEHATTYFVPLNLACGLYYAAVVLVVLVGQARARRAAPSAGDE